LGAAYTQDSCTAKSDASASEHDAQDDLGDSICAGLGVEVEVEVALEVALELELELEEATLIGSGRIRVTVISSSPVENERWLRLLLPRNDMAKFAPGEEEIGAKKVVWHELRV